MRIIQIKAKVQTVCVASEIYYAEIELCLSKGGVLYITVLEDDCVHYSVSKNSIYDYMSNVSKKCPKLLEEYHTWGEAKTSEYIEYFKILKRIMKDLDK